VEVFGRSRTVRTGADAGVIALGNMVQTTMEAAEILSSVGVEVEVLDGQSVKPLDAEAILDLARRHALVVTVEDHAERGGFGSAVAELLGSESGAKLVILGWPDRFIEHGSNEALRGVYGLDARGIASCIREHLEPHPSEVGGDSAAMLVTEIPSVTPAEADELMEGIRAIRLNEAVERAMEGYERVGERDGFLWKWVRRGVEVTSLSSVEPDLWDAVCDTKTLGVMFDVLVDDVADAGSDPEYLERLIALTEDQPGTAGALGADRWAYLRFAEEIWREIWTRVRAYPRFAEFRDILRYDYRQLMNVMRYSALTKRHPVMMNPCEHDAYLPHNMHMMVSGTIDLMASNRFDARELGAVRQALWYAQQMGRIGNLVTTWEREIEEGDYSSGVFALGVSEGVFGIDDLAAGERDAVREAIRGSDLEERFLRRWRELRCQLLALGGRVATVDVEGLAKGLELLLRLHLASRGLK
jgi:hypothetical protein